MIHGHGDDLYRTQGRIQANFSTNVWYEADTRPLCDFLSVHLKDIFHYPEPDAGSFCRVAAEYHGVEPAVRRNCFTLWRMPLPDGGR